MEKINLLILENSFYNQADPRRCRERRDAQMVQEDKGAVANLSQKAIVKQFNSGYQVEKFRFTGE
jgi:hypothetical protein